MPEVVVCSAEHGWYGIDQLIGQPVRVYLNYTGLLEGILHSIVGCVTIRHDVGITQLPLDLVRVVMGIVE